MNLITNDILEQTKQFWNINKHSIFHNAISLVISQKVSFNIGRNIRIKLFDLIGLCEFTPASILILNENQLKTTDLDTKKIILIKMISKINTQNDIEFINKLHELKGIGIWTINALQILNLENSDVFLVEDLWIRKRLSELYDDKIMLTIKKSRNIVNTQCTINKSDLTKFLWRIKPEGIVALKNKEKIIINHFL